MPTDDFRQATLELFQNNQVHVLEWSFDFAWTGNAVIEPWCQEIIDRFSVANTLVGHGVNLSPLSARLSERQADWLARAREEFSNRNYLHATEHFGFSEAGPIAPGAPLAVPMNSESFA